MFTVFAVDDDSLIIEELKAFIEKNPQEGFTFVGGSTNPIEALTEIEELKPNLVILDVLMNEINGLELATKLNNEFDIVFLSGYDRFDYAIEAIKLKALRYITKPLKESELINVFREIRKKEELKFANTVFSVCSQLTITDEEKKNFDGFFENSRLLEKGQYKLISVYGEHINKQVFNEIFANQTNILKLHEDSNLVLLYANYFDDSFLKSNLNIDANIIISPVYYSYENMYEKIRKIRINSKIEFFGLKNKCFTLTDENDQSMNLINKLNSCSSLYELQKTFEEIKELIFPDLLPRNVQKLYNSIVLTLANFKLIENPSELLSISAIDYYENFTEMCNDLFSYLFTNTTVVKNNESIVNDIIEDVKLNMSDRVSLSKYSNKYGYNTSYLSQLFKKTTGISFVDFVSEVKMKHAMYLIQYNVNMSFKEVASNVGYFDYYHFSKMFKKFTGMSPLEFRSKGK